MSFLPVTIPASACRAPVVERAMQATTDPHSGKSGKYISARMIAPSNNHAVHSTKSRTTFTFAPARKAKWVDPSLAESGQSDERY